MTKTLMLLGAGPSQLCAIDAARRVGCRVVIVDPDPRAPGMSRADASHAIDLADTEGCLSVARRHGVDGVMTLAADYPIPVLAEIVAELGLTGLTPAAARLATNKAAMRERLRDAGLPVPASILATDRHEARRACRTIVGPRLMKPTDSSGGRGVTALPPDAGDAVLDAAFESARMFSRLRSVVVEEQLDGPEFSVEGFTRRGRTEIVAVTEKTTTGPPYFVEVAHSLPAGLAPPQRAAVEAAARAAIAALGIDDAASHTEIILGDAGPQIVEVGARLGGGFIASHLVPLATGLDLVEAAVRMSLGEPPPAVTDHRRGAAIRFLLPVPGRVVAIRGVASARAMRGVHTVEITLGVGDVVHPLRNATHRVGHVIAEAEDALEAQRIAEHAADRIEIDTTLARSEVETAVS